LMIQVVSKVVGELVLLACVLLGLVSIETPCYVRNFRVANLATQELTLKSLLVLVPCSQ